ncbi:MAG: NAD(P)H-dependent oxidoreductase [Thermodesulfobacteriota bacterium]
MTDLLYVTCNVRNPEASGSLSLGHEFLEEYLRWNPQKAVRFLDLYRDSIQRIDQDLLDVWERIGRDESYALFSDEERRKIYRIWRLADQFGACDRYIFVTHSLNLWFPAEFKTYVDAICVPGRTYRLTPQGAKGTFHDGGRRSLHLHAGPPFPFGKEQDQSVAYLRSVLQFLGVTDQVTVLLPTDNPERSSVEAKEKYKVARRRLLGLARVF